MQQRKLGKTDLSVSQICLGTMTFGQQNTQDEAFAQMDYAVANGVNFFDTAELYAIPPKPETYGKTEEIVGNWLQKSGKRKDVVIATKVVGPAQQMTWIRNGTAHLERSQILAACDASLKRLQTDYIDLYQIHWPERQVNSFGKMDFDGCAVTGREEENILETLQALADLMTAGKVRHIGVSNETPWGVMTWLKLHANNNLPRIASIQNAYNLLNRTFSIGLSEVALQEKVGLLAYSPLGGGTLTGKYLAGAMPAGSRRAIDVRTSRYKKPKEDETVSAYQAIAKKHGLDAAQMALAFVNRQPFVTSNIIGATSVEQLKINIASADIELSNEVVADINQAHQNISNPCP